MEIREIKTVREVVAAIGRARVMTLTRKRTNNVSNWISAGRFPPETFYVLTQELQRIGCRARPALWKQITSRERRAA